MFRLLPTEMVFFDLFERAADNVRDGAEALLEFLEKWDDLPERAKRIKDIEHAGDDITHEVIERLNRTFITPLDREDIHEIAVRLDDVIDLIDTAVSRLVLYKVEEAIPPAKELARCLVHATRIICKMMPALRNMRNADQIRQMCRDVHTQENEGDRIEHLALAGLFEQGKDPFFLIKWKNI